MRVIAIAMLLTAALPAQAFCFAEASKRYDVPEKLLRTIAKVESGMRSDRTNKNKDGSEDIGLMQINTSWLPVLKRYGIERADLWNPCTSVHIAAWIMAKNIAAYGYTWEAVGAYNARSPHKRERYAKLIFGQATREKQNG